MTAQAVQATLSTMPGVADCAVFDVPGDEHGVVLLAAVQVSDGDLTVEQVQSWLRERVSAAEVPRRVVFYAALPRNEAGQIASQRLRAAYWNASG